MLIRLLLLKQRIMLQLYFIRFQSLCFLPLLRSGHIQGSLRFYPTSGDRKSSDLSFTLEGHDLEKSYNRVSCTPGLRACPAAIFASRRVLLKSILVYTSIQSSSRSTAVNSQASRFVDGSFLCYAFLTSRIPMGTPS